MSTTLCPKIIEEGGIAGTQGLGECTDRCAACEDVGGNLHYCKEYKEAVTPREAES